MLWLAAAVSSHVVADARVSDLRLSPDGSRVVAIQTTGRTRVAVVADLASGRRGIVAGHFRPRERLDACDWVTNQRLVCSLFMFRNRPGFRQNRAAFGDERLRLIRLFAVDHDGGNPRALLDGPLRPPPRIGGVMPGRRGNPANDLEQELVSRLIDEPRHVLVSASRQARPYTSVYRVDIHDGTGELAVGWQPGILLWHADWQGRVRLGTGQYAFGNDVSWGSFDEPPIGPTAVARPSGEAGVRRLDVARLSSPVGPTEMAGPRVLGFALDGRSVYYAARIDGADLASVWEADAVTFEPVRELIAEPERDVAAVAIGGQGCGTVGFAHPRGIMWLDPAVGTAVTSAEGELAAMVVHVPSMSADCRHLVLASREGAADVRFHLLDRNTGALRNLGGQRARGRADVRTVRQVDRFATRDGLELPITLTLPEPMGESVLPIVVVLAYDHGWSSDPAVLDDWPHAFASRGYVVAQPAFRGSQGYGVARHLAGLDRHGVKIQEDVADAVAWLATRGIGDPQRVCFAGRGRGGHMAMAASLGYAPPDPAEARLCVAALAALEVRHTKRAPHNVLDARMCTAFPCGDWMRWAAPAAMRLAALRTSAAKPAKDTPLRSPVVGAAHPGFPVLLHVAGRSTVHDRTSLEYRSDLRKISFFEHVAFAGGDAESAFLDDAVELFAEVLDAEEAATKRRR